MDKKIPYQKPILIKEKEMTFTTDIINAEGKKIVCKQCSGCHGCR